MSFINCQYHVYYDNFSMQVFGNINALMVQRRRCCANILMIVFAIMNISGTQHRMFYDDYSMHVFGTTNGLMGQRRGNYANISLDVHSIINVTTMQRRRCCAFDSPGLARNEPTLGKHPQGDSTPSVLSFF